jgi:protein disulfide-isomerase A6
VGAVNCDEEKTLCSEYSIQGFPTIKFFSKNKRQPTEYSGGRDASDLVAFGKQQWSKFAPAPEVCLATYSLGRRQ